MNELQVYAFAGFVFGVAVTLMMIWAWKFCKLMSCLTYRRTKK